MDSSRTSYPNIKREYQYCDTCGSLLPAPGFFCVKCDPPEPPEPDPEKGLDFSQTYLRIALLALIFMVVVVVKLEINPLSLFHDSSTDEIPLQVAEDKDYEMFFKVNVSFANLRDAPNTKTSTILFVLTQGTEVEILEKKGKWSKIRSKPKAKDSPRTGWLASKLIDSEIK